MKPIYLTITIITCTAYSTSFAQTAAPQASQSAAAAATTKTEVATNPDQIKLVVETQHEPKEAQQQEAKNPALGLPFIHTIGDIPNFIAFITEKLIAQPLCIGESPTTEMEYTYKKLSIKYWFDAEIYRRLALIVASRYISTDATYDETTGKMTDRSIYYLPDNDEKNFTKEFSLECSAVVNQLNSGWTECTLSKNPNPGWRLWKKDGETNSAILINALLAKFGLHKQAFALWNWDPSAMSSTLCLWIKKTHVAAFNKKFLTQFQANNA